MDYIGSTCRVESVIDTEVVAPFVSVKFTGRSGDTITVGNRSTEGQGKNKAVISNFHFAFSDGAGVTIEIVDEEGGMFTKFFDKLVKTIDDNIVEDTIEATWGWVNSSCGNVSLPENLRSKTHYLYIKQISTRFEDTMKYVIECTDSQTTTLDSIKSDDIIGQSGQLVSLKDAIRQIFEKSHPPTQVKFKRRSESGEVIDDWDFEGPSLGIWHADKQSPRQAVNNWIDKYVTKNKKGIRMFYDDTEPKPTIVLWEDSSDTCKDDNAIANIRNIGPFLVNGGQHSNVIQFNPTYNWNLGSLGATGGIDNAGNSAATYQQQDGDTCDILPEDSQGNKIPIGAKTDNVIDENAINIYGSQAAKKARENEYRNSRANITVQKVEAELVIQGSPKFDNSDSLLGVYASIIVINPFHLNDFSCPEWVSTGGTGTLVSQVALSTSTCHSILSNKKWLVKGIAHDIQAGSYTTTLKVMLEGGEAGLN